METTGHGQVFDIERFAVHDGPGIRSTVFLKGCPLRCAWCHNPESQSPRPQVMFLRERCRACGACVEACPEEALALEDGKLVEIAGRCRACGACAEACPGEARRLAGREMSVDEVMAELERDEVFYRRSGGGVSFSGGEPLAQPDFLAALLEACGRRGWHRALDSCGHAPWKAFERALGSVELILYDLKLLDDEAHRRHTGEGNERILENLRRLDAAGAPLQLRYPLIPGVNDRREDLEALAAFVSGLKGRPALSILPFHRGAAGKYRQLGLDYDPGGEADERSLDAAEAAALLENQGLEIRK